MTKNIVLPCDNGTCVSAGNTAKCLCNAGFYSENRSCVSCPENTFSTSGATSCTTCLACHPSFTTVPCTATSNTTCICPIGSYIDENGVCVPCAPGTSNTSINSTSCVCSSGYYTPDGKCAACPAGYKCSVASQQPVLCEAGTYSAGNAASCTPCAAGSASDVVGATSCQLCPLGSYSGSVGQTSCSLCSVGTYASRVGSVECKTCPVPLYSLEGADHCTALPPRSIYNADRTGYVMCGENQAPNFQHTVCENKCYPGTYWDVSQNTCVSCPTGTRNPNFVDRTYTACELCKQCENVGKACDGINDTMCACPEGQFINILNKCETYATPTCTGTGVVTIPGGASNNTDCGCAPGYKWDFTQNTCAECPAGTYNPSNVNKSTPCQGAFSVGGYTYKTGSTAPLFCPADNTPPEAGITCSHGSYTTNGLSCNMCNDWSCPLPNMIQYAFLGTIGTRCACKSGYYWDGTGCTGCPVGTYKYIVTTNDVGSQSCQACPDGYYNDVIGSNTCTACPAGTHSATPSTSVNNCEQCVNKYSVEGSTTCFDTCPPGSYQTKEATATTGGVCIKCAAGTYYDTTTAACLPCATGKVSAAGATTCGTSCPAGTRLMAGTSVCYPCRVGQYNPLAGQNNQTPFVCKDCPVGQTSPLGSSACYTPTPVKCESGSISLSPVLCGCAAGHYWDLSSGTCVMCPNGTFNPNNVDKTYNSCQSCTSCENPKQQCTSTTNTIC